MRRRNEVVATDTFFSDTPAIDSGVTCAQYFVGLRTRFQEIVPMPRHNDASFVAALCEIIRKHGAPDTLYSDCAGEQVSKATEEVLQQYMIDDGQSEPHHQHQNLAENYYGKAKGKANCYMAWCGCPASCWLLVLMWICLPTIWHMLA